MPVVAVLPFYRIGATPLALEIMRVYNAGSSVYASCYSDAGGTTAMGNSDAVPIQADGNGLFPVVFVPVDAAYDIKFYYPPAGPPDLIGPERDTYEGIRPGGGGGGGGEPDHYTVLVDAGDSAPGYLSEKVVNTTTVTWETQEDGGYKRMAAKVNPAGVLDGKVKIDEGDANPGFLLDKLIAGHYIGITKDGNQIVIAFTGPDYVPKSGGKFDGTVEFGAGVISLVGNLLGGGTEIRDTIKLPDLPGAGEWLHIDIDGNVTRGTLPVAPVDDHLVLASDTDTVPGALRTKLQPGAGMRLDSTIDPDLGEIVSISMINIPTPIAIPVKRIVLGSGPGVTSYANLTYYNKTMIADSVLIETFYLGLGSYAGFSNGEVRAVPTRNFKDGITQYADGTIRIGADGDACAIKLDPVTKDIATGIDTTWRVFGKMIDPGGEITSNTYTLPLVAAGETRTIRFNGAAGCTITAHATQVPRYRNTSNGLSTVGTGGGQVDAAAVFGVVAGCKVAAITIKGISATVCQVQY